jgi:hypothetical protein
MAKLIDLPSEVLMEVLLYVFLGPEQEERPDPETIDDVELTKLRDFNQLLENYSNSKALTKTFTTDMDILHSCQGVHIVDTYQAFCSHRCHRKTLLALSLTCKRLHEIAEPFIWDMIETDQESKGSVGDLVRILATMMRRPELARHVKALAFRHYYDENPRPFSDVEKREMSTLLDWDVTHQVAALFDRLPQLQSLKLAVEYSRDYFDVFRSATIYPSGFPLGLQNLTELSFHWEDPDADAFEANMLLPLFLLPNLKTLYLGHPMASAEEGGLPPDFTRYIGTSKITNLIIDFGLVDTRAINAFLKLPAALESFTYTYGGGSNRGSNAEIHEYYRALLPQRSSLKKLKIRGCRDMQFAEDELAPDPSLLKCFPTLQEFSCPIRLLLFREPGSVPLNYKLESVLPPNIEKLTLYAYDDWMFHKLDQEIKNFFSSGQRLYPGLKKLRAECWLKEEDYALHGGKKESKEDAMGVIQWRIETLKFRGKDKGVELEVELDTTSRTVIR